ncbi:MAG: tetratricopeptide repeat protein [Planctomycetes bacterium]|nr:tetratricopeptide repeat protein [Planctomycetota bacterium]
MGRAIFLGLCLAAAAFASAEERAAEAKALFDDGRYDEALAAWTDVLKTCRAHAAVTSGDAHWYAAQCHARLGRTQEAADLLAAYVKAHPEGAGEFRAQRAIFDLWVEAGDAARAQAAGAVLLRKYPDAKGCYAVLRTFLESGWKPPKLATSYDALSYWTFDRTDGRKDPDLRLAFLDLLEKLHPREPAVKEGGTLYSRAWCHLKAGRYREAIDHCETYLRKFPAGKSEDLVRGTAAEALLRLDPPDAAKAQKHLGAILADPKARNREEAERLMVAARSGGPTVQLSVGLPRAEGLGRTVLLTSLAAGDARLRALEGWRGARGAEVVRFPGADVREAAKELARIGPEFVAVAVPPTVVDINFHFEMLELCRDLDEDPMPDFHFGYLCARDARDLAAFAARILEKEARGGIEARETVDLRQTEVVAGLDLIFHLCHGQAWCVEGMLTGEEIAQLSLPKAPVVFSGACFNGVLSRSWHDSALKLAFLPPKEIEPKRLVSLAWVHAGASALLAALEGDRGEMAAAEWEYFRSTAAPLGEVVGLEYRLAFTSLPETFPSFPRYVPGRAKRTGFYDVMLRGMVSRLLLSDPGFRPLREPLAAPVTPASAARDEATGAVTVTVEAGGARTGYVPFTFINVLPKSGRGAFDRRLYARVELPGDPAVRYGPPAVRAELEGAEIPLTRHHVKHEVWGGRRFVNVQAESEDGRLARPGARATFVLPAAE